LDFLNEFEDQYPQMDIALYGFLRIDLKNNYMINHVTGKGSTDIFRDLVWQSSARSILYCFVDHGDDGSIFGITLWWKEVE